MVSDKVVVQLPKPSRRRPDTGSALTIGSNCPGISGTVPDLLTLSLVPEGLPICPGRSLISNGIILLLGMKNVKEESYWELSNRTASSKTSNRTASSKTSYRTASSKTSYRTASSKTSNRTSLFAFTLHTEVIGGVSLLNIHRNSF